MSARFTTIDPIRDGSNWFSYVVNDPVNYCDPFGLSSTDSSWWSNVKSTVKGWGESIKSDLIQTWNDIKGVVSTTISDTKAAVSAVVANVGKSITAWTTQAKAAVNKTLSDFSVVGNNIKTEAARLITKVGVNLFGGDVTKQLFNAALEGPLGDITSENNQSLYNLISGGLKKEVGNTKIWNEETPCSKLLDIIIEELNNNGVVFGDYNAKIGELGSRDMGTAIGGHTVHIESSVDANGNVSVRITANDYFNFEKREDRTFFEEALTAIGRNAGLPASDEGVKITVQYDLVFKKNTEGYYYAE